MKRKVLIISGEFPPKISGIGEYALRLAEKMTFEYEVHIYTIKNDRKLLKSKKVKLLYDQANWSTGIFKAIDKLSKKHSFEFINIQYPSTEYRKSLAINFLPFFIKISNFFTKRTTKVIVTIHEFSSFSIFGKLRQLPMMLFSNKIIAVNPENIQNIIKLFPFLTRKINFIPIGCNLPEFKKSSIKKDISDHQNIKISKFIIGNPGTKMYEGKGVEYLIKAYHDLLITHPEISAKLVLWGRQNAIENRVTENNFEKIYRTRVFDYQSKIHSLIKKHKLENKIIFVRFFDELSDCFSTVEQFDVAVFPFDEGYSLRRGSILWAVRFGIPIITTRMTNWNIKNPNIAKIRKDIENAFLWVDTGNARQITNHLKKLYFDQDFYSKKKEDVLKLNKYFDWNEIAKKYTEITYE